MMSYDVREVLAERFSRLNASFALDQVPSA
jgi:hypothetical protein